MGARTASLAFALALAGTIAADAQAPRPQEAPAGPAPAQATAPAPAAPAQAPAQPPPKPFTLEVAVDVVSVTAVVFDKSGHFVRGLGTKDIALLEDGVPQEVSYFREASSQGDAAERVPLGRARPRHERQHQPEPQLPQGGGPQLRLQARGGWTRRSS